MCSACSGLYHKPISLSHFFALYHGKYELVAVAINSVGFVIVPLDLIVNKSEIFMLISTLMKTRGKEETSVLD